MSERWAHIVLDMFPTQRKRLKVLRVENGCAVLADEFANGGEAHYRLDNGRRDGMPGFWWSLTEDDRRAIASGEAARRGEDER